jgi:hypothetical protein
LDSISVPEATKKALAAAGEAAARQVDLRARDEGTGSIAADAHSTCCTGAEPTNGW